LREENEKLSNELINAKKLIKWLQSYGNYLKSFSNNCKCHQNINNQIIINLLQNQFKSISKFEKQNIDQNINQIIYFYFNSDKN
jgi:hypothetical protein